RHYPFSLKMQAVQMRLQGVTKREVAERLGIHDVSRLKVWLRQYKLKGSEGLQDRRGGRKRPLQKDEYVRQLELENDVLKKVVGNPEQGGMNAKHQMVQELRDHYTIQDLCRYLKISRSGYYRYLKRRDGMNPKEKDLKEKTNKGKGPTAID